MKIRELKELLENYHPEEPVGLRSESGRNMTFLGVDRKATSDLGHLVLKVDFTISNRPVEKPQDALRRQRDEIKKAIKRMDVAESKAWKREMEKAGITPEPKKKKRKSTRKRTTTKKTAAAESQTEEISQIFSQPEE